MKSPPADIISNLRSWRWKEISGQSTILQPYLQGEDLKNGPKLGFAQLPKKFDRVTTNWSFLLWLVNGHPGSMLSVPLVDRPKGTHICEHILQLHIWLYDVHTLPLHPFLLVLKYHFLFFCQSQTCCGSPIQSTALENFRQLDKSAQKCFFGECTQCKRDRNILQQSIKRAHSCHLKAKKLGLKIKIMAVQQ